MNIDIARLSRTASKTLVIVGLAAGMVLVP
jgi:hypothetical protein